MPVKKSKEIVEPGGREDDTDWVREAIGLLGAIAVIAAAISLWMVYGGGGLPAVN